MNPVIVLGALGHLRWRQPTGNFLPAHRSHTARDLADPVTVRGSWGLLRSNSIHNGCLQRPPAPATPGKLLQLSETACFHFEQSLGNATINRLITARVPDLAPVSIDHLEQAHFAMQMDVTQSQTASATLSVPVNREETETRVY